MSLDGDLLLRIFPAHLAESYVSIFASLSALTALSYDIILSMELEVKVIWMEKWSYPKVLYLLGRYMGLVGMILTALTVVGSPTSTHYCSMVVHARYVVLIVSAVAVELILLFRIYALYAKNKSVLILTAVLLFVFGGISLGLVGTFLKTFLTKTASAGPVPAVNPLIQKIDRLFPGCYTIANFNNPEPGSITKYFWIPLLMFESYMFFLTLVRFFQSLGGHRKTGLSIMQTHASILTVFYRDGTIYFAVIFVSLMLKVLIVNISTTTVALGISGWTPVVFSIAGPRLLLNLRATSKAEEKYGTHSFTPDDIESRWVAAPNLAGSRVSMT